VIDDPGAVVVAACDPVAVWELEAPDVLLPELPQAASSSAVAKTTRVAFMSRLSPIGP
jgi:hypothetical protein